jgi:hypothetical protein
VLKLVFGSTTSGCKSLFVLKLIFASTTGRCKSPFVLQMVFKYQFLSYTFCLHIFLSHMATNKHSDVSYVKMPQKYNVTWCSWIRASLYKSRRKNLHGRIVLVLSMRFEIQRTKAFLLLLLLLESTIISSIYHVFHIQLFAALSTAYVSCWYSTQ